MRISILHQDPDLVVVDKPAGIPTHAADPADPYPGDALRIVQAQTGLPYLGMHQRLDAETSGVLLFAARREANRALAVAFEGREVRKVYLAWVHGSPPQPVGTIDAAIVREHGERYRVTSPADPRGLPARTRYRAVAGVRSDDLGRHLGTKATEVATTNPSKATEVATTNPPKATEVVTTNPSKATEVATTNPPKATEVVTTNPSKATEVATTNPSKATEVATTNPPYSLLELTPETGRPHQIRVHLAHIGCPVVGDALYGPVDRPAPRLCLHAYQLTLPHPATGEMVTFIAPLPEGLRIYVPGTSEVPGTWGKISSEVPGTWGKISSEVPGTWGKISSEVPGTWATILKADPAHVRDALAAPDAVRALLRLAVERRSPLAADPDTTLYRLVNAAADGLPGLTVDRCGDALVASIYDDGDAMPPPPAPEPLIALLAETAGARSVYVKYRPREAGRMSEAQLAALTPSRPAYGPDREELVVREEGLSFLIRPGAGLSIGLFPDMREGRARVRAWAGGRRVLNCFAYTCGFGVAALAGGAQRVLNLDLSRPALEWGQANYRANGFEPDPHDFVYGDVFDWLARLARRGDRFDLVILDPPGFSRTKTRRFSAEQDYGELAALAARVTAADGRLLACCNVAELPWRAFRDRVLAGLAAAGRTARVAGVYHEPAVDFPVVPGEQPYLKMALLEVG